MMTSEHCVLLIMFILALLLYFVQAVQLLILVIWPANSSRSLADHLGTLLMPRQTCQSHSHLNVRELTSTILHATAIHPSAIAAVTITSPVFEIKIRVSATAATASTRIVLWYKLLTLPIYPLNV